MEFPTTSGGQEGGVTMQHHQDDTSRALLEAAHRLLTDHGSEALTVRRIATEAGMSTMNVYSRFGGKDGVVDELFIDGFTRLFEAVNSVPETADVPSDLREMARAYRAFALDHPTYYKVMFRLAIHDFTPSQRATDLSLSGLVRLVERIARGQALEQVRVGDGYAPPDVAAWLWASCHGLVSLELFGIADEIVVWSSVFETGMATAIDGLRPSLPARG
jgi:AcrR family transcriptional regulator